MVHSSWTPDMLPTTDAYIGVYSLKEHFLNLSGRPRLFKIDFSQIGTLPWIKAHYRRFGLPREQACSTNKINVLLMSYFWKVPLCDEVPETVIDNGEERKLLPANDPISAAYVEFFFMRKRFDELPRIDYFSFVDTEHANRPQAFPLSKLIEFKRVTYTPGEFVRRNPNPRGRKQFMDLKTGRVPVALYIPQSDTALHSLRHNAGAHFERTGLGYYLRMTSELMKSVIGQHFAWDLVRRSIIRRDSLNFSPQQLLQHLDETDAPEERAKELGELRKLLMSEASAVHHRCEMIAHCPTLSGMFPMFEYPFSIGSHRLEMLINSKEPATAAATKEGHDEEGHGEEGHDEEGHDEEGHGEEGHDDEEHDDKKDFEDDGSTTLVLPHESAEAPNACDDTSVCEEQKALSSALPGYIATPAVEKTGVVDLRPTHTSSRMVTFSPDCSAFGTAIAGLPMREHGTAARLSANRNDELDGNELDGNELDGNALDGNELDGNELDGNELDGNELDDNERGNEPRGRAAKTAAKKSDGTSFLDFVEKLREYVEIAAQRGEDSALQQQVAQQQAVSVFQTWIYGAALFMPSPYQKKKLSPPIYFRNSVWQDESTNISLRFCSKTLHQYIADEPDVRQHLERTIPWALPVLSSPDSALLLSHVRRCKLFVHSPVTNDDMQLTQVTHLLYPASASLLREMHDVLFTELPKLPTGCDQALAVAVQTVEELRSKPVHVCMYRMAAMLYAMRLVEADIIRRENQKP